MGGTDCGYGTDYITTASSNSYLGTGDDWRLAYNIIDTTLSGTTWRDYTSTDATVFHSVSDYFTDATLSGYTKYATGSAYNEYLRNTTWNTSDWGIPAPIAPGDRLRRMIQDRMAPAIRRSRTSMSIAMDVREQRARQTLRRIIGEQTFRKFMRDGFITVVPKSGLTYKIYPGLGMTEVYDRGIMVDRLCVVLQGQFPPTDSLLMRYLLILNDEGEFSQYAIKHHVSQSSKKLVFPAEEVQPLTEAWAKWKVA